jgi:uncharacterized protein
MDFINQNLALEDLPSVEEAAFKPLETDYLKAERISYTIGTLVALAIIITVFYLTEGIRTPAIISTSAATFVVLTVVGWIAETVSFNYSGYALRQKDLLYRKGWLVRKTRVVPINRIQHISVQSGPIERMFKLASVSLYTAGSNDADFTIRGITKETAFKIKEWLSEQVTGGNDANAV